jgi:hypothetical protein
MPRRGAEIRSTTGQWLKRGLPFAAERVSHVRMVIFAAAALASLSPSVRPPLLTAQATATIRVIRGVQLKFGAANSDAPPARDSVVKAVDGSTQRAKLIEFQ